MTQPDPHRAGFRIYYEDTDAAGIVYHANYLRFAERGRTDLLRTTGWDHARVKDEFGLVLVVRRIEIDYRGSARLDDWIEVRTDVTAFGSASFTMMQAITRGDALLAEMKVVIVAIDRDGKPLRIPPQLRQILGDTAGQK